MPSVVVSFQPGFKPYEQLQTIIRFVLDPDFRFVSFIKTENPAVPKSYGVFFFQNIISKPQP